MQAAKHPTMHSPPPTWNYPARNDNSARTEKPSNQPKRRIITIYLKEFSSRDCFSTQHQSTAVQTGPLVCQKPSLQRGQLVQVTGVTASGS